MAYKILVTGALGQLGQEVKVLSSGTMHEYLFTDIAELDITNKSAIHSYIAENNINTIINCAAYTNVERAESECDKATEINTQAVAYLAEAAALHGARLIHISTDYVFDGKGKKPLTEEDTTMPLNIYGKTKRRGEEAIIASGCRYVILRTAWLYSPYGNNFVKSIIRLARERKVLTVVNDQVGTPTYAADLAAVILHLVESDEVEGIFHYTNEGTASWYDFAASIVEICGMKCTVRPCSSREYRQEARRPSYSVLDKTKIKRELNIEIPHWRDSLCRALRKMNE